MFLLVQYDKRLLAFLFTEWFNQVTCLLFKLPVRMILSC